MPPALCPRPGPAARAARGRAPVRPARTARRARRPRAYWYSVRTSHESAVPERDARSC